ncbi:MAG: TIM barrel protein [Acidobacteriaceae bacterium]|nr:TIM barrel protein [Acidobacteriaceae bacterium]
MKIAAASLAGAPLAHAQEIKPGPARQGRLKQSVCRWCYKDMSIDDLCRNSVEMGLVAVDLVAPNEWPTLKKYGLVSSMVYSGATIPEGWNRKENHDRLIKEMQAGIERAAANKLPNVITFSGNRRGMSDEEGKENCILGLRRVSKMAEDANVIINMELLNSKVNHPDYMCDHTAWGVAVVKGVGSPNVKLLYDIYHMQIMEGDIIRTIRDNIQYLGHFHTGGVPGRHELDDTQELQWRTIAKAIADLNFQGYFAHEFVPTHDPMTSLRQAAELCTV